MTDVAARRDGAGEGDDAGGRRDARASPARRRRCRCRGAGRRRTDARGRRRRPRAPAPCTGQVQAPAPGRRRTRARAGPADDESPHAITSLLSELKTTSRHGSGDVGSLSNLTTASRGRAGCGRHPSGARRARPRCLRGTPAATSSATAASAAASSATSRDGPAARPSDERDLALRRLARSARRPRRPCRARPPRTASSARGRRRPDAPASTAASERSVARSRCGDSNATAGSARSRAPARARASARSPRGRKPRNWYALADEPGGDERRLDRRCAGEHRHLHACVERRRDEPRAGVGDRPAARVRDERDPLARLEPRHAAPPSAPPRCARGTRPAAPRMPWRSSRHAVCRVSSQSTTSAARSSASTRSVTSSRLPIGVAQTASGTIGYAAASSASKPTKPAPIRPADRAELGRHDPAPSSRIGRSASRRMTSSAARMSAPRRRRRSRRRSTISSGSKMFANDAHAPSRGAGRCRRGSRSACSSPSFARRTSRCASAAGPNASCARDRRCEPGHVRLQMAAPGARALAGPAVVDDHDVAELAAAAVAPRNGLPPMIAPPPRPVPRVSISRSSTPRPAPTRHSAIAAAFASLSSPTGQAEALATWVAERDVVEREVDRVVRSRPRRWSIGEGTPKPIATTSSSISSSTAASSAASSASCASCGVGRSWRRRTSPSRVDDAGEDLRPAEVDADRVRRRHRRVGTVTPRWPRPERSRTASTRADATKGKVPLAGRDRDDAAAGRGRGGGDGAAGDRRRTSPRTRAPLDARDRGARRACCS